MNEEILKEAVFKINTASGTGSGFYISEKDLIVTNFHVVEENKIVSVQSNTQDRYIADVVYINPDVDIAFLKLKEKLNITHPIIISDNYIDVKNRDKVIVLGFPFGMPFTVTEGIVSNNNQLIEGKNYIQTDAAINPGNSGGPVLDMNNRLVGVISSKFTDAENIGFAIPANIVIEELSSFDDSKQKFGLKCDSCKNVIYEKVEDCPNCGARIDDSLFEEKELDDFAVFVESAIDKLNINPILAREGNDFWRFHQGSSLISIFVYNTFYLHATSPLNELPTSNIEELYSYLLSDSLYPYKLGIYKNQIYITYRAHISDISSVRRDEIIDNLSNLAIMADKMDDFLEKNYQCVKTSYSKSI
jgi:hypothetical protein